MMNHVDQNGRILISFYFIKPHTAYKYLGGTVFPPQPLIVVKEGSNSTWNCGDTIPVNNIITKAILLKWIGYIHKYISGVIFYLYLSKC